MARLNVVRKMVEKENEETAKHTGLSWGDWRLWLWREIKYAVWLLALAAFVYLFLGHH